MDVSRGTGAGRGVAPVEQVVQDGESGSQVGKREWRSSFGEHKRAVEVCVWKHVHVRAAMGSW